MSSELLTGKLLYNEPSILAMTTRICTEPVPSVREQRADLSRELDRVVLRCLEKDPARRVQSVAELASALRPFASKRSRESVTRIVNTAKAHPTRAFLAASATRTGWAMERGEVVAS